MECLDARFEGMTFVITGSKSFANRKGAAEVIEGKGGRVTAWSMLRQRIWI